MSLEAPAACPAELDKCSSGSDATDESINLQDFVVVPSEISSPESPHEEDLEGYSDAQLKALLDEAITYKSPKEDTKPEDAPKSEKRKKRKKKKKGSDLTTSSASGEAKNPLRSHLETWLPPRPNFYPKPGYPLNLLNLNSGLSMQDFAGYRLQNFQNINYKDYKMPEPKSEPKKPEVKREGNAIVRRSHEIDGYRGCENIDRLVEFIESSDAAEEKSVVSGRPRKIKKAPKVKQLPKKKTPQKLPEVLEEVKLESRVASGSTSPCPDPEASDFRVVMNKKKKPKN